AGEQAEEVGPSLPPHAVLLEPGVGLVDDGRRLQGVAAALVFEGTPGDPPELLVGEGHGPLGGVAIAAAPALEQLGKSLTSHGLLRAARPPMVAPGSRSPAAMTGTAGVSRIPTRG